MAVSPWVRLSTRRRPEPLAKELARTQLIRRAIAIGRALSLASPFLSASAEHRHYSASAAN
jgi:hypothetical protein